MVEQQSVPSSFFHRAVRVHMATVSLLVGVLNSAAYAQSTPLHTQQPATGNSLIPVSEPILDQYGSMDADAYHAEIQEQLYGLQSKMPLAHERGQLFGGTVNKTTPVSRHRPVNHMSLGEFGDEGINPPLYLCLSRDYSDTTLLGDITHVICPDSGIKTLAGLEALSGLQNLDMHNTVNSRFPNTFNDLSPLLADDGSLAKSLRALNLSGHDLSDGGLLFSSLTQELSQLTSLRHLNLSKTKLHQLPDFAGFGRSRLSLQSLDLRDNDLTNISGLASLRAINYLWLDGNPLGNRAVAENGGLDNFQHMISLSLRDTGLNDEIDTRGLPNEIGFLDLSDNHALRVVDLTAKGTADIVFTLDMRGNSFASCLNMDEIEIQFNRQVIRDNCVGNPGLGEECFLSPRALQRPEPCTPAAPERLVVQNTGDDAYEAQWSQLPAHWNVTEYRLWFLPIVGGHFSYMTIPADRGLSHAFSLSSQGHTNYLFAIQACHITEAEYCGPLSTYVRPVESWSKRYNP